MKKTLIASAVAATLSANAFADNLASKIDAMPKISGSIAFAHVSADNDTITEREFQDNGSFIGISHEHAVSEGLTAFAHVELLFAADNEDDSNGIDALDYGYIGVRGDFGSVQVGQDDTVYDWIDMLDTGEAVSLGGGISSEKRGDNLQYVSPMIADGLVLGVTAPIDSDSNFGGAIAAKYTMDNLDIALAYAIGRDDSGAAATGGAEDTIGLGVSYKMDDLTLIAQYETQKDTADLWGLQGMYTMGQNVFALGYQSVDFDGSSDKENSIYVQALHNMSSNLYIYLEYLRQTDVGGTANSDLDTLAVGATYSF